MHVVIAGAGYVGLALAEILSARGTKTTALRRDVSRLPADLPLVAPVSVDLEDASTLAGIPGGVTDVVYAASPAGGDDRSYEATYVRGVATLIAFLSRRGDPVRRFVLTTSTGVYAQSDGDWVDEGSETRPTHHSGRRMLEGETLVREAPFEGVVVRFAGIYGPGRTQLVDRVRTGTARTPRTPLYTNRIHRDDCAGILAHLLAAEHPAPVYVGVDREPADLGDVQAFIASRLGVPRPPLDDETASTGFAGRSMKRCRSLLLAGYPFRFPTYREGYAAMLGGG